MSLTCNKCGGKAIWTSGPSGYKTKCQKCGSNDSKKPRKIKGPLKS